MKSLVGLAGILSLAGFSWVGMGMHDQISTNLETQAKELLAKHNIEDVEVEFDHIDGIVRGVETEEQRNDVADILASLPQFSRIQFDDGTSEPEEAKPVEDHIAVIAPLSSEAPDTMLKTLVNEDAEATTDATQLFSNALQESEASFVPGETQGTDLTFVDDDAAESDTSTTAGSNMLAEQLYGNIKPEEPVDLADDTATTTPEIKQPAEEAHAAEANDIATNASDTIAESPSESIETNSIDTQDAVTETAQSATANEVSETITNEEVPNEETDIPPSNLASSPEVAQNIDAGNTIDTTAADETPSELPNEELAEELADEATTSQELASDIQGESVAVEQPDEIANEADSISEEMPSGETVTNEFANPPEALQPPNEDTDVLTTEADPADSPSVDTTTESPSTATPTPPIEPALNDINTAEEPTTEVTETPTSSISEEANTISTTNDTPQTSVNPTPAKAPTVSDAAIDLTSSIESAKIIRPRLGVYMTGIANDNIIRRIDDESSADRAGLKNGDRIVRIGTQEVASFDDVKKSMANQQVGDIVRIWFERQSTLFLVDVRLRDAQKQPAAPQDATKSTGDVNALPSIP